MEVSAIRGFSLYQLYRKIDRCKGQTSIRRRCLLFGGSVYISYIGRSAGAKARRPLDGGVCYSEVQFILVIQEDRQVQRPDVHQTEVSAIRGFSLYQLYRKIGRCKGQTSIRRRCPLFGGSVYISYIGRSAGAKARRPLDRGVRYSEVQFILVIQEDRQVQRPDVHQTEVSAIRGFSLYQLYRKIDRCKGQTSIRRRCLLFGGSVYISYIGRSAGAKARRPLDGGVCYSGVQFILVIQEDRQVQRPDVHQTEVSAIWGVQFILVIQEDLQVQRPDVHQMEVSAIRGFSLYQLYRKIDRCKGQTSIRRRCLLFGGSVYISYIGRSAGAKARRPLDGGVCYSGVQFILVIQEDRQVQRPDVHQTEVSAIRGFSLYQLYRKIGRCKGQTSIRRRCLLFGGSVYISYIGRSAGAKARHPLDGGVCYSGVQFILVIQEDRQVQRPDVHQTEVSAIRRFSLYQLYRKIGRCKGQTSIRRRCPLFGGSIYISYIGRSTGAKARRPLDGGVCYSGVQFILVIQEDRQVQRPDVHQTEVSAIWSVRYKRFHCIPVPAE